MRRPEVFANLDGEIDRTRAKNLVAGDAEPAEFGIIDRLIDVGARGKPTAFVKLAVVRLNLFGHDADNSSFRNHYRGIEHASVRGAPWCSDHGGDPVGGLGNRHQGVAYRSMQTAAEKQVFARIPGETKLGEQRDAGALIR